MSFKVVNTIYLPGVDFGEKLLDAVDAKLSNVMGRTEKEIMDNAGDADAVICSGPAQPWTRRVIRSLPKCRIIASLGVGYDRIDLEAATECGIAVTNVPDYCLEEVSDTALTLMLALNRRLFRIDRAVRERRINLIPPNRKELAEVAHPVFRLSRQTLGVIGMGKIGATLALKARGLGLGIIAYDPYASESPTRATGAEYTDLDTLLRKSDFVSINTALTPDTRNMIGPDELAKMKPTAYLINTARGEIVDQEALAEALRKGVIAGAGLDVTTDDPMNPDNPFLEMDNVILTGHSAWYSVTSDSETEFWHRAMSQAVMALKGEWPEYVVNRDVRRKWLERWGR